MMDNDVTSKIQALFDLREFPQLMREADIAEKYRAKLIDLQLSIYQLDAHLESQWILDRAIRRQCWESIYEQLTICGVSAYDMDPYCEDIYTYEEHEINIRKGISPSEIPIKKNVLQ